MKWIKNILREIFGLFVDDGAFALAIVVWLGLMRWTLPRLNLPSTAIAGLFFAGLALILIESTIRFARHKR